MGKSFCFTLRPIIMEAPRPLGGAPTPGPWPSPSAQPEPQRKSRQTDVIDKAGRSRQQSGWRLRSWQRSGWTSWRVPGRPGARAGAGRRSTTARFGATGRRQRQAARRFVPSSLPAKRACDYASVKPGSHAHGVREAEEGVQAGEGGALAGGRQVQAGSRREAVCVKPCYMPLLRSGSSEEGSE